MPICLACSTICKSVEYMQLSSLGFRSISGSKVIADLGGWEYLDETISMKPLQLGLGPCRSAFRKIGAECSSPFITKVLL